MHQWSLTHGLNLQVSELVVDNGIEDFARKEVWNSMIQFHLLLAAMGFPFWQAALLLLFESSLDFASFLCLNAVAGSDLWSLRFSLRGLIDRCDRGLSVKEVECSDKGCSILSAVLLQCCWDSSLPTGNRKGYPLLTTGESGSEDDGLEQLMSKQILVAMAGSRELSEDEALEESDSKVVEERLRSLVSSTTYISFLLSH